MRVIDTKVNGFVPLLIFCSNDNSNTVILLLLECIWLHIGKFLLVRLSLNIAIKLKAWNIILLFYSWRFFPVSACPFIG